MRSLFCLFLFFVGGVSEAAMVYVPSNLQKASARILVVIHGCLQSAESMALGAGFNALADAHNLIVVYPQVPAKSHPLDCWGWYEPVNQRADSGQLKFIVDEVRAVKQRSKVFKADVMAVGISSGGVTVAGLLACFPAEFKGGAIHSGPSYGLAQDANSAKRVLQAGPPSGPVNAPCRPRDFSGKVFVIQGMADAVVNPLHADRVVQDFIGEDKPTSVSHGRENGLAYTQSDFASRGRLVQVQGLPHAWSGSKDNFRHKLPTVVPFFSEAGPNATRMIWEFLR